MVTPTQFVAQVTEANAARRAEIVAELNRRGVLHLVFELHTIDAFPFAAYTTRMKEARHGSPS